MALHATLRPLAEIDSRTEQAWAELGDRAAERNPFFEPIVARALERHLGSEISLLSVERGGDMLLCVPLRRQTVRWHRLPLRVWTSWDPLGVPLVDAAAAEEALRAAIAHLSGVPGPGFLVLDWVPSDGPVAAALGAASADREPAWLLAHTHGPRPALCRRDDGDYLGATLRGKHRRRQANKRRNLERELGAPLRLVDESGSAEAIERLLALEVRGWKGRMGSAVLCRPQRAGYFREICTRFAEQGRMQVLSLQAADTTVAIKCDIRAGDMLIGLRMTYDERFARASPGVELEIAAIGAFHAGDAHFWDSATNHVQNPQYWLWPDARPLARVVVSLDGALGRLSTSRLARAARRLTASAPP